METTIVVALIGAAGVVVAAIINACVQSKGINPKNQIKQKAKGNNTVQIGIQNNCEGNKGRKDE